MLARLIAASVTVLGCTPFPVLQRCAPALHDARVAHRLSSACVCVCAACAAQVDDPYTVVMRSKKLPMQLLVDPTKNVRMDLLSSESFQSTFGPKRTRKRPKLLAADLSGLVAAASAKVETYDEDADKDIAGRDEELRDLVGDKVFDKGTSRRIWGELYKVLDCSDVIIQVRLRVPVSDLARTLSRSFPAVARTYTP